ncbi:MAG: phospholipid scramblase-related protein, partial [Acidimicrobiia bacterium]|nr:phospholipid scramblase-related protein [Acidimicrobiia bacterium]
MTTDRGWLADPTKRHQYRYWDGSVWTEHVADNGVQGVDVVDGLDRLDGAMTVDDASNPDRIREQVTGSGYGGAGIEATGSGGGDLFSQPVLVVNQKAKLIELSNQYGVFDQDGNQLGSVNQVGQSTLKKAMRLISSVDQFMTHRMEIADQSGTVLLRLTRPAKVFKSTIVVEDPIGRELGRIVQRNMVGKINFGLESGGQELGTIKAENWRAWNFRIEDIMGSEIARITKTWEGLAKTMFTTADNYVVQIHGRVPQPLLSLVIASALSIDTALKQDDRGW